MLPTLFAWQSIQLSSLSVISFLAVLVGAFVFWRKTRQENYPEASVFDGWILAQLFGLVTARLAFVAIHFNQFSWQIWEWFNWWGKPGLFIPISLLASAWYLWRFAQKNKWDEFEVLDFWALGSVATWLCLYVGFFLDGSFGGLPTTLPVGLLVPGMVEKTHPASLYALAGTILSWWYMVWSEFRYRSFDWYRAGKQTAQTGFLFSVWLIGFGFVNAVVSVIRVPEILISLPGKTVAFDTLFYAMIAFLGVIFMWHRSGRGFGTNTRKKIHIS